ncbi:MAG: GNAT family N-acetyltransferase [Bacteroidota bacterium]
MTTKRWDAFYFETDRLYLLACNQPMLEALTKGDQAVTEYLQITVPPKWSIFGASIYNYTLLQLKKKPADYIWWTYLAILKNTRTLIGAGGFKGAPDADGVVEIGYEISKAYQGQQFATEMAKGLIDFAFSHEVVNTVQAHTAAKNNASTSVLKKCGMKRVQTIDLGKEGTIWQWKLKR